MLRHKRGMVIAKDVIKKPNMQICKDNFRKEILSNNYICNKCDAYCTALHNALMTTTSSNKISSIIYKAKSMKPVAICSQTIRELLNEYEAIVTSYRSKLSNFPYNDDSLYEDLKNEIITLKKHGTDFKSKLEEIASTAGTKLKNWHDKDELLTEIARIEDLINKNKNTILIQKLKSLERFLCSREICGKNPRKVEKLKSLKDKAITELQNAALEELPPDLTGTNEPEAWILNTIKLENEDFLKLKNKLGANFFHLFELLGEVDALDFKPPLEDVAPQNEETNLSSTITDDTVSSATIDLATAIDSKEICNSEDIAQSTIAHELENTVNISSGIISQIDDSEKNADLSEFSPIDTVEELDTHEIFKNPLPTHARTQKAEQTSILVSQYSHAHCLPGHIIDYNNFHKIYWVNPINGEVQEAPWVKPDQFIEELRKSEKEYSKKMKLSHWYICAKALEKMEQTPLIPIEDIRSIADIWFRPTSELAGRRSERRKEFSKDGLRAPMWRLKLFLEAIRPNLENPLNSAEGKDLIKQVGYENIVLGKLVGKLLDIALLGQNPVQVLQQKIKGTKSLTEKELSDEVDKARSSFHNVAMNYWQAAGGRIKHAHCREAWTSFINEVMPPLKDLYPQSMGGKLASKLNTKNLDRIIQSIVEVAEKKAETHNVLRNDRKVMDRSSAYLAEVASRANDLVMQLERVKTRKSAEKLDFDTELMKSIEELLSAEKALVNFEEEVCRKLLDRVVSSVNSIENTENLRFPIFFSTSEVCINPLLLTTGMVVDFPSFAKSPNAETPGLVYVETMDVLRAAAILSTRQNNENCSDLDVARSAIDQLFDSLVITQRFDLLGTFSGILSKRKCGVVLEGKEHFLEKATNIIGSIRSTWFNLDELAIHTKPSLNEICCCAEILLTGSSNNGAVIEFPLVESWLKSVETNSITIFTTERDRFLSDNSVKTNSDIYELAQNGQYAAALQLLGRQTKHEYSGSLYRETYFRAKATSKFGNNPLDFLDKQDNNLAKKWKTAATSLSSYSSQSRAILREILSQVPDRVTNRDDKDDSKDRLVFQCENIREQWKGRNPVFLPQLASFKRFIVVLPNVQTKTADFTARCIRKLEDEGITENDFVLVLAPGLNDPQKKDNLDRKLRSGGKFIGVADDIDACRMIRFEERTPDLLTSLIEIAFEQMDLRKLNPFNIPEGQHIKMEMFVGRQTEARTIALESSITRIFSGRKLGKSALLKYVKSKYDGAKLPSSNTLKVVYVPLVGVSEEDHAVERIITHLKEQTGFNLPQNEGAHASRLSQLLDKYICERKTESLLIVLDEADAFVESQISKYDFSTKGRENCLSFKMRSEIGSQKDSQGLPRIRFVFAGYRVTNQNEGAWGNWGSVLFLGPLNDDEAMNLIAGPLGRLGIHIDDQGRNIAYRCGNQPAILLAFGNLVLEQFGTGGYNDKSVPAVSIESIVKIFHGQEIHQAIKTNVHANFQKNDFGSIIFRLFLMDQESLVLNDEEEIEERILKRIMNKFNFVVWLGKDKDEQISNIKKKLDEFVERKLLTFDSNNWKYSLKFPHHLSVLLQENNEEKLRQEIEFLNKRFADYTIENEYSQIRSPIPLKTLQEMSNTLEDARKSTFKMVIVFASNWQKASQHKSYGLEIRLRLNNEEVYTQISSSKALQIIDSLQNIDKPHVFEGGADLLRTAFDKSAEGIIFWEFFGFGRVPAKIIGWWYERVLGLIFETGDAVEKLIELTGGIPFLINEMDNILLEESSGGINIDQAAFNQKTDKFSASFELYAKKLTDGPENLRLNLSEIALVKDIVELSPQLSAGDKLWDYLQLENKHSSIWSDNIKRNLCVLFELGILPAAQGKYNYLDRLMPLNQNDPLIRLAKFWKT